MHAAAAGVVYLVVTALLFRELLPDLTTHLYSDLGDPLLNASILEWSARHVPLSEAWWNFPSFAPLSGVTAFTEHLLAAYPVSTPIIWLTGNAVLAHNIVLLLAFPLNGLAAYFPRSRGDAILVGRVRRRAGLRVRAVRLRAPVAPADADGLRHADGVARVASVPWAG